MAGNKRDLTIGIDGDPKGFDAAAKSAQESAKVFDRELGKAERQLAMVEQRTKATADAIKKYGTESGRAALLAKKFGDEAEKAGERAARAQLEAAEAAEKLADGEGDAARAAELAAHAEAEVERAAIKAAEAHRAAARAADQQAQQERQLARDAALAAAAERLGSLRAQGALVEHNAMLRDLQKRFPELEKDAGGAFKLMTSGATRFGSGLDSLTSGMTELEGISRVWPALILTGLQLLPAVAAAAGGAITLGLGGAITAVAILAAAKNKDIRAQYASLGKDIFGHLQQDAAPFIAVLQHIGMYAEDEFRSWNPLIKSAFADLAPDVDAFVHEGIKSLDEFKPAFSSIVKGFRVQLAGLGPELPSITHNIATGLKAIGDAAQDNPQALAEMAHDLSLIVRAGGDVIGFFTRFEGEINLATEMANAFALGPLGDILLGLYKLKNLAGSGGGGGVFGKSLFGQVGAAQNTTAAMFQTGVATEQLKTAQQLAAMSTDQLKQALDRLTGANQNAFDSETQYKQALAEAEAQGKKNSAGIHGNSAAALANRQALSQLSQAIKNNIENGNLNSAAIQRMRDKFVSAAVQMGVSRAEANRLANQLLGVRNAANSIPSGKRVTISSNASVEKQRIDAMRSALDRLHDKNITITTYYREVEAAHNAYNAGRARATGGYVDGYAAGGPVRRFPTGGPVRGPGTTTSDSIPSRLSNREYVVNAEDTARNRAFLDAMNYGHVAMADLINPMPVPVGGGRGGDGASITVMPSDVYVSIDGQRVFAVVQEHGKAYVDRNHGRSPFATSAGG